MNINMHQPTPFAPASDSIRPAVPDEGRGGLTLLGILAMVAVYGVGVAAFIYLGWVAGAMAGLMLAEPQLSAPPGPGVGLAPDLQPTVDAGVRIGLAMLGGVVGGFVVGQVVMACVCRYPLFWLLRRVPGMTQTTYAR
jgi:hypothetical protein